ncbi:purine nucleosidase [Conyzicola lurida]|uniref:Purine nucleosidase n=1 Tax=Conyzicola lurida TaxID=1172621 RepID=A0A841AP39_9MICO|nr:nucleoside hydrolase [Conyzicola lurida]MBB5843189.1 purine nucleosidase [Conyzicola lurida]
MTTARAPYYLDCDTGIDDALAIGYLLAAAADETAGIEIVGIGSVSGNVSASVGAYNTLDLLALAGAAGIPVAIGAHDPQGGSFRGGAPHVHGANGVGDVEIDKSDVAVSAESAAELLVRLAHEHEGELRVIAIGPLTNIAEALRLDPELPGLVKELTLMGGAARVPGNITPVAEANIANDADAAAEVFAAEWFITMVPLDVTMTNVFLEHHRQTLIDSGRPVATALGHMLDYYFEFYVGVYGHRASALHDPLAVAIALGEVALKTAPVVRVLVDDTAGPGRGQTICDLRGSYNGFPEQSNAHTRVVLELESDFAPVLLARLLTA